MEPDRRQEGRQDGSKLEREWRGFMCRMDRRYKRTVYAVILIGLVSLGTGALAGLALRSAANQDAENALYETSYRICARESVDRAYARWRDPEGATGRLPLLDCAPNKRGQPARVLTPPESQVFIERFIAGLLTPEEQGICEQPVRVGRDTSRTECR